MSTEMQPPFTQPSAPAKAGAGAQVLTGVLEHIVYQSAETGFCIGHFRLEKAAKKPGSKAAPSNEPLTISGKMPGIQCGETLAITGKHTTHPKYGPQFEVKTFESRLPATVHGIKKYLGSGLIPGIGKGYAEKIVNHFGEDTLRILSEESGRLKEIPGLGRGRIQKIKAAWDEQRALREVMVFLQTYGVGVSQCLKIIRRYGSLAIQILRDAPFRVAIEIDGIGFKTADAIARNLGLENDHPQRLEAGLHFALTELEGRGFTCAPEDILKAEASRLLDIPVDKLAAPLESMIGRADVIQLAAIEKLKDAPGAEDAEASEGLEDIEDAENVEILEGAEEDISNRAHEKQNKDEGVNNNEPELLDIDPNSPEGMGRLNELNELNEQRAANMQSLNAADMPEPTRIQSLPLFRAEGVIAEALERIGAQPSELPAINIDAAITWAQERAGFGFAPEQSAALKNALSHKVAILTGGPGTGKTTILRALVDILRAKHVKVQLAAPTGRAAQRLSESTRAAASTLHRLLAFDPAGGGFAFDKRKPLPARFIIVDEASMLDTKLAAALLDAVHGGAHLLLVGDPNQLPSVGPGNVLKDLITVYKPQTVTLRQIFRQGKRSGIATQAYSILKGESDPPIATAPEYAHTSEGDFHFLEARTPEDCTSILTQLSQTLANTQKEAAGDIQVLSPMQKGGVGAIALNEQLQQALNPNSKQPRAGLKFGTTTFFVGDRILQTRNDYDKNLFNGDLGTIVYIDHAAQTATADFDTGRVKLEKGDFSNISLAYAISIHKSQGSEFHTVCIVLMKAHYMLLERKLLYTGLTRGRRKAYLIGDPEAYQMAVRGFTHKPRVTGLKERLTRIA